MDTVELQSFYDGYSLRAYEIFGAHFTPEGDVVFRLYAPNARSVRVVGDFNGWNRDASFMSKSTYGFWELKVEKLPEYSLYKYVVEDSFGNLVEKADPYGFYNEMRPSWASKVVNLERFWTDGEWMKNRSRNFDRPLNIYEVHLSGWKHNGYGNWLNYDELCNELIPYVRDMGYTHIELMPLNEYPLDASWGYQQYGYFSITSRYGSPQQLMHFIDECHQNGIGVIMDVVLIHFLKDSFGLGRFDGTPLYESSDPVYAQSQWGTYYFDFSKPIVKSFLMSSVGLWIEKYHIDGIRVDAVSNLIYYHGNKANGENTEAISFAKRLNYHLHSNYPTVMTIAEDSSDYYRVTGNENEGLGFDYKWDLGWMNDTVKYYNQDPEYRHYAHNLINFSMAYFYSENFILPFSHDEVVHAKGTVLNKMFGDYDNRFRQARNLMVYMYTHPGKKLNFMGNEFASYSEFNENRDLDWNLLSYPAHDSFRRMVRDLNLIYRATPALYRYDFYGRGFHWIDADNNRDRIYSYCRFDDKYCYVVILNMAPVSYENYEFGVPVAGKYTEVLNSEKDIYGGCNMCNYTPVESVKGQLNGYDQKISIRIAPYAGIIFCTEMTEEHKNG